jgi:NAD-dependent SIR2 family protein deacetylase
MTSTPRAALSHVLLADARAIAPTRAALWLADRLMGRWCRRCPFCERAGAMRPHVVWFGEIPLEMDAIAEKLNQADLFVAIGTSGAVYPAAGFVATARRRGIPTCALNLEPSDNAELFDISRYGRAGEIVPAWVDEIPSVGRAL